MPYDKKEEDLDSENQKEKRIEERLQNFLELGLPVHISLKSGNFLNGTLIKRVGKFYVINERVLGMKHILASEVFSVDLYVPRGGESIEAKREENKNERAI